MSEKPEGMIAVPRASGAARHLRSRARHIVWWHADLRQDVDRQDRHRPFEGKGPRQGRHSSRPATIDLRRKQPEDGKTLSDNNVQKESSMLQDINEVHGMVNTDLIETAEFEDLIGQTSQCLHSGKELHESQGGHAPERAEVRRCTEDEAHDLTIECQARGGCKGCVGVPRGSLAVRNSDCQPDRPIVVASGGVLRYTHIPTPLDDSTRALDNSTNSTIHKELALW